ncbi:Zinc finger protein 70 [Fasciola hepatica]|uniref:Zinc finger protein 70 n=1 Tax=Fasciola hepatica TaxID=6192 RepID=A0A4E0RAX4_FASHE|nr:Zinc finger protein 70 [Fasciola hepatica]
MLEVCDLIPDEARKPDRSVLQHAAEQLWSKLKVDATSVTGLDCSLAACSTNTTTTTANTACQPRTILANLFIITTEKSIFPTSSSIVTHPSGSTFPISCETCGKEFIQPSNYSRHLRIHTKERPYACNLCSAQFPYSTSLKRHQQRDHGVDLLSCRVCSKTFLNETSLVRHRTGCELRACVTTTGAELCAQLL